MRVLEFHNIHFPHGEGGKVGLDVAKAHLFLFSFFASFGYRANVRSFANLMACVYVLESACPSCSWISSQRQQSLGPDSSSAFRGTKHIAMTNTILSKYGKINTFTAKNQGFFPLVAIWFHFKLFILGLL